MSTLIFTFDLELNGAYADADFTPVLSDATGTYGIRRTDTNATVVADGTAMTRISTGRYVYHMSGAVAGVNYQAFIEFIVNGNTQRFEKNIVATAVSDLALSELRTIVRYSSRNGKSSSTYSNTDIDYALKMAMDEFVRDTKCTKLLSTLTITEDDDDLPAFPVNMLPENILELTLLKSGESVTPNVQLVKHNELLAEAAKVNDSDYRAQPEFVCFPTLSTGKVFPIPDDEYTLNVWWYEPATNWTMGTSDVVDVFNIPTEALRVIASTGAVYYLQGMEPENAALAGQKYQMFQRQIRSFVTGGIGGRGAQVLTRDVVLRSR